jgi:hypothetical protein
MWTMVCAFSSSVGVAMATLCRQAANSTMASHGLDAPDKKVCIGFVTVRPLARLSPSTGRSAFTEILRDSMDPPIDQSRLLVVTPADVMSSSAIRQRDEQMAQAKQCGED